MKKSLDTYNDYIIDLYKQTRSLNYISEQLYKKCNTKLKAYNKNSGGMWFQFDERHTKAECSGHVYNTIYQYIRFNK